MEVCWLAKQRCSTPCNTPGLQHYRTENTWGQTVSLQRGHRGDLYDKLREEATDSLKALDLTMHWAHKVMAWTRELQLQTLHDANVGNVLHFLIAWRFSVNTSQS
mmetsp:Transcript_25167/g.49305  ORF Transcript_25167/g.49305 Transcript_25167/m.49305 type:complete len:105 (+) Transcript_25167:66-380(+)